MKGNKKTDTWCPFFDFRFDYYELFNEMLLLQYTSHWGVIYEKTLIISTKTLTFYN